MSQKNINEEIRAKKVLLIDNEGVNRGVVDRKYAIQLALECKKDLVQMSNDETPTCKIMDYGRVTYEQDKLRKENSKKSKKVSDKELRMRPSIGKHDMEIKAKQARKFVSEGRTVMVNITLKGRERSHPEIVTELMEKFTSLIDDIANVVKKGTTYYISKK